MLGACKTSLNESSFWQFLKFFKVGNPLTWFYFLQVKQCFLIVISIHKIKGNINDLL
jgi:hypothetical protein